MSSRIQNYVDFDPDDDLDMDEEFDREFERDEPREDDYDPSEGDRAADLFWDSMCREMDRRSR